MFFSVGIHSFFEYSLPPMVVIPEVNHITKIQGRNLSIISGSFLGITRLLFCHIVFPCCVCNRNIRDMVCHILVSDIYVFSYSCYINFVIGKLLGWVDG